MGLELGSTLDTRCSIQKIFLCLNSGHLHNIHIKIMFSGMKTATSRVNMCKENTWRI